MGVKEFHSSCKRLEAVIDTDLPGYLTKTKAIEELAKFDSDKILAVGAKGIGKTTAFRFFTEFETSADVIIPINTENYTLHLTNRNLHYSTCLKQFQHDLVIEALRAIIENRSSIDKKVDKALIGEAAKQFKSYKDTLLKLAGRFRGISVLGCGFTTGNGNTPVFVGLRQEKDIKQAFEVLQNICKSGVKIRIVVDDPEQVFSASKDLDTHLIGGFCLAALRLSILIPQLKVIVLIKTHVYYPIFHEIDDIRKFPDVTSRLVWTIDELIKLVEDRLNWAEIKWGDVFNGGEKKAIRLIENMCKDVRNGPRDLLRWLDLSLQATKRKKISSSIVDSTKGAMSSDSLGELVSAYANQYQNLGAVIRSIFRQKPHNQYNLKELKQHIETLLIKDSEMKSLSNLPWMHFETAQTLPELLYEIGVLALKSNGQIILPYQEGYNNENFETAEYVMLTPALIEAIK